MSKAVSVQVLRALSAVIIIAVHATERSSIWHQKSATLTAIYNDIGRGAVMLFFVISGFIIVYSSYRDFGKDGATAKFALNRVVRIVPMYWLATFFEFSWRSLSHSMPSAAALACSLLFIPMGVESGPGAAMRPVLGVGWTLNYEMMFYAILGLCIVFSARKGIALMLAVMLATVVAGTFLKPLSDTSEPTTVAQFWTDPIILTFVTGVLIGYARRSLDPTKFALASGLPWALGILGATCALAIALIDASSSTLLWRVVFWAACGAAVGLCAFEAEKPREHFVMLWSKLGDATYSVYLFHYLAIIAFEKIWLAVVGETAAWTFVAAATVFATVIGLLIYAKIELPITEFLRARVRRKAPAVQRTSSRGSPILTPEPAR